MFIKVSDGSGVPDHSAIPKRKEESWPLDI